MAVAVTFRLEGADQADHDRLQEAINAAVDATGAPPDGLLVHVAHEVHGGFVAIEVFRSDAAFESFWTEILEPALTSVGLRATTSPPARVLSLARP